MAVKTASFLSTHTIFFNQPVLTKDIDNYANTISNVYSGSNALTYMIYSWDYSEINSNYSTILDEIENSTILSISVKLWTNLASGFQTLHALDYLGGNPFSQSAATIDTRITSTELGTYNVTNNSQELITVELNDVSSFYDGVLTHITNKTQPTVIVFARDSSLTDNNGQMSLGGQLLVDGGAEWRSILEGEVASPPLLLITYETAEESHPELTMKYTTSDPSEEQDDPSNSVGGYLASNEIYPSADLGESISSSQTTIPIDSDSSLPTASSGLASVGPEVFRYSALSESDHSLISVSRGIAPMSAFPAGFNAYQIAEKVYYLHNNSETNLNYLFNSRPSSGLVQYRCIAISNDFTADNFSIKDISVGLVQNSNADTQIDIGIEIPRFDSHTGTADASTTTSVILDSAFSESNGYSAGFFDGAAIKVLSGINLFAIVETFDDGEFILDRTVTGLASGVNYVIYPAPSQIIINDATDPASNSGLFLGFLEAGGSPEVVFSEHGTTMHPYDCFYVWIKRTLKHNVKGTDDIGAVILVRFMDNA